MMKELFQSCDQAVLSTQQDREAASLQQDNQETKHQHTTESQVTKIRKESAVNQTSNFVGYTAEQ